MRAVQYREIGKGPEVVEIDVPEPGPGQIRLEGHRAGLCHSDWFIMDLPEEQYIYGLPLTLGHEGAGIVDKLGAGVRGHLAGRLLRRLRTVGLRAVSRMRAGTGELLHPRRRAGIAPRAGAPGAMAEYMIVDDARHLVPLADLDPVQTVSLTDAGLTPYHAIRVRRRSSSPVPPPS